LTAFTEEFSSVASREIVDRRELRARLLLMNFGLGTNIGIKRVVDAVNTAGNGYRLSEAALRRLRRLYGTRDNFRRAVRRLVNATFEIRDERWWGDGTAWASDSQKFGSWSSNFMTEWHIRYGGPGVMIYWHVERRSACIYSQLKTCSALDPRTGCERPPALSPSLPVTSNDSHVRPSWTAAGHSEAAERKPLTGSAPVAESDQHAAAIHPFVRPLGGSDGHQRWRRRGTGQGRSRRRSESAG
jgi:hypothetical protein